jgi:hypothetical protein
VIKFVESIIVAGAKPYPREVIVDERLSLARGPDAFQPVRNG